LRDVAAWRDLTALIDRLLAVDPADPDEAEATVAAVARLAPDQSSALLTARLAAVREVEHQCSLLRVVGQIGGAQALATLRKAAAAGELAVRLTVIRLLAEWPTDEPLNDLLGLVRAAQDEQQRTLALRGYIRLIGLDENRPAATALTMYREAMGLASNAVERRMVLSGLASLKSPATLEIAAEQLKDPDLRAEAEAAVLQIARGVAGAYRERTRAVLQQVAAATQDDSARRQVAAILQLMDQFGDYLTAWEVSPVYRQDDVGAQGLFDLPFAPEIPAQANTVNWRLMPAGTSPEQP
jgi:hypothetical protein